MMVLPLIDVIVELVSMVLINIVAIMHDGVAIN